MVCRLIWMSFRPGITTAEVDDVRRAQLGFATIPGVRMVLPATQVEAGAAAAPGECTHCAVVVFVDEDAREHYIDHPIHVAARRVIEPLLAGREIIDIGRNPAAP